MQPEKEIVLLVTGAHISSNIGDNLLNDDELKEEGEVEVFISPTVAIIKTLARDNNFLAD